MKRTKKILNTISAMYHTLFRNTRKLAVCFSTIFSFPPSRKAPYLQKASISVHSSHQSSFQLPSTSSSSPLENKFVDRILRRHKDEREKDDSDPPLHCPNYQCHRRRDDAGGKTVHIAPQTHHFKVLEALVQSVSSKGGAPNHFHKSHQQEDRQATFYYLFSRVTEYTENILSHAHISCGMSKQTSFSLRHNC